MQMGRLLEKRKHSSLHRQGHLLLPFLVLAGDVDGDLNFDEFAAVINNVLVGKLGNFCYRTLTFAEKNYAELPAPAENKALTKKALSLSEKIKKNRSEERR